MLKEFQQFLIVSMDLASDCGLRDDPLSFVLLSLLARCFQRLKYRIALKNLSKRD